MSMVVYYSIDVSQNISAVNGIVIFTILINIHYSVGFGIAYSRKIGNTRALCAG